jgi:CubicO group peptidase (beta-lactamase class C family)
LDTPLVSAPGADFKYSNVNTMLLSIVLTRATGQRYVEFLSEQLWKPLGAQDAAIWLDDEGGIPKTYCCLLTTARDWARVGLLLLHRGRVGDKQVVPAAWIEQMLTPSPTEENYGYHIWLGYTRPSCRFPDWTTPFESADSYMLVGRDEQRVFVVPAHQLVIVRIGRGSKSWDDPVLPNIAVRALRETSSLLNPTGAKARK